MFTLQTKDIRDVQYERVEDGETPGHDEESPGVSTAPQSDGDSEDDVESEGASVH